MDEKPTIPPVLYGVWLPGAGWLRVNRDGQPVPFADAHREVAAEVARCIGRGAVVRFIDIALMSLESDYLAQEKRKAERWHISTNWRNFRK